MAAEDRASSRPTPVDRLFQLAYVCAYQMMRVYWALRRPSTHGALVLVWHEGRVLIVKNSYVRYHSLPGGYVRHHETGREAALRELREEVGVAAHADALELVLDQTNEWEGKLDRVEFFALEVSARPAIAVDHREVVSADWYLPAEALRLELFPPLRTVLERRIARVTPASS
ncbi:MAG: NUDIX hydrolase [Polyangiaceae bacterium]|nr:NUDIX hydrolase [Polyangiaceae bacterium]